MTTDNQKGFLLGLAAKGFLKGGGTKGKFIHAQILKPTKGKIILAVRNETSQ